ncbi:hypothetical protein [Lacipirellula limnantheis]|uniref:hypothetical protein n=1 Tax=Lacipirellula limnantheis TaxID=2528024 RepID=UPI00119F609C|nr:hypothetical protein [Lacipirellula limnantheis]
MLALNVALRDKRPQTFATFAAICREAKNAKFLRKKSPVALISLGKSRDEMNATAARGIEFCGTLIGAPRRARKSKIRGVDFWTFGTSRPKVDRRGNFVSRQKRQNAPRQNAQPQAKPRLELARFLSPKIAVRKTGDTNRHPEQSEGSSEPKELPDSSQS